MPHNLLYAQSGGPTAVINATASAVITAAHSSPLIRSVYAAQNGIVGALKEDFIHANRESKRTIAALQHTPASVFGSCRHKLREPREFNRLFEVFAAHDIRYFLYNGGNDSQDTTHQIAKMAKQRGYPLQCIGLPKTIDNDLALTDNCPGFGSAAKYIAVSVLEASRDVAAMCRSSTKVFILEVMGRHAGWLAAAAGLAQTDDAQSPPQLILFPEVAFNPTHFLTQVQLSVKQNGYCVIVASEGVRDTAGQRLCQQRECDAFGHQQLGGVAPLLATMINTAHEYKVHWSVPDYLQRAAGHLVSVTDHTQALAIGEAAIAAIHRGEHDVMLAIARQPSTRYSWKIISVPLAKVANREKTLPKRFIRRDGFGITSACRTYLVPLIKGEYTPPYRHGIPIHASLKRVMVARKLPEFNG